MQKSLILILFILADSCTPKLVISEEKNVSNENTVQSKINRIREYNISEEDFFIEKATISIRTRNESKKFVFNCKFQKPGKYLLSLKSSMGIEGARIYIEKDTLLINDRIDKRLLFGKPKDLEKVSGIPYVVLKRIFGDLFYDEKSETTDLEKNRNLLVIIQQSEEGRWKSILNPNIEKIKSAEFSKKNGEKNFEIKYSKFEKGNKHVPQSIEFIQVNEGTDVKIRLLKIVIPWDGVIEFVPGKGYIKEEIK